MNNMTSKKDDDKTCDSVHQPLVGGVSRMRKTASVDFSSLRTGISFHTHSKEKSIASQFSLRAARGSFSSNLFALSALDEASPCSLVRKTNSKSDLQCEDVRETTSTPLDMSSPDSWLNPPEDELAPPENSWAIFFRRFVPSSTQTVGQIFVCILLLGSLMSNLNSEVAPAASVPSARSSSISLGSAAISSVTEALSPILPFAGGVDLRREDYWSTGANWWEALQGAVVQLQDAFSSVEFKTETASLNKTFSQPTQRQIQKIDISKVQFTPILSAQTPFVSLDAIGDLTLGEMAETFRYAMESSQSNFSAAQFLKSVAPRVKPVIEAMQTAVQRARGANVKDTAVAQASLTKNFGQVDALKFAAAMRIFAEWRVIRLVPDGYKGYAVGMNLGHKDIVQNIAKIEMAVQQWLEFQRVVEEGSVELRSPTLYDLLNFELAQEVHPNLPYLKEKSAAMGLLWVRRQLQYQTRVFENALMVPTVYATGRDAIGAAYKQVYDRYHGWAVQKIFNYSFQAAPDPEKIFASMNPHQLRELMGHIESRKGIQSNSGKVPAQGKPVNTKAPENPLLAVVDHVGGEWNKIVNHIGSEWSKFAQGFGKPSEADKQEEASEEHQEDKNSQPTSEDDDDDDDEAFVQKAMELNAQEQITVYLKIVNPLLAEIGVLFDVFNMDDPTKV